MVTMVYVSLSISSWCGHEGPLKAAALLEKLGRDVLCVSEVGAALWPELQTGFTLLQHLKSQQQNLCFR